MNDQTTPKSPEPGSPRNKMRPKIVGILAVLVAAGGLFGANALADSKTFQHAKLAAMEGSWHGGWRHGRRGAHFAKMSDEELRSSVTRMVRHAAIEVEATPEQEERIIALATAAALELRPMHSKLHETREKLHDLLIAADIDRAALEQLRTERLADFDRISEKLTTTLADIAEILTPEQRMLAEERLKKFRDHRHGGRRG